MHSMHPPCSLAPYCPQDRWPAKFAPLKYALLHHDPRCKPQRGAASMELPLKGLGRYSKWWSSCSPGSTNLVRTLSFANPPTRSVGLRKPTRRVENHTPWLACKEPRQGIDGGAADTTSPVLTPKKNDKKYDIPGHLALILHLITVYKIHICFFSEKAYQT